jgi:hypothetical protein
MLKRLLVVLCLMAVGALAQSERGNITGIVTDATGASMSNLLVLITNQATNTSERVTTTNSGEYNAANLSPGKYRVEIEAPGFKRFVEAGITLTAGNTLRVDAQLQIGQLSESVEVKAQVAQTQTENAKVTTAVENKMVDDLPLVVGGAMRSPFDLTLITAETKGSGSSISLGGGQAAAWSGTLDGLLVNTNRSADAGETAYLTPSVESLTEFAVDTNGFSAEFGQAGGGVITFVSKSGTNEFHGDAYEFLRNDDFDARGFFAPTRSIYKQSDFGATAGGPVILPKLYHGKNKTFFFVSYEGFRNRIGSNGQILSVPTPEMYQGNFSNWVNSKGQQLVIYDPSTTQANANGTGYTRTPFPGNQIPASRFSSVSQGVLGYAKNVVPNRPNLVPGTIGYVQNNYVVSGGLTETPTDKGSVKIDQNFGYKHHLAFFYNKTEYDSEPGATTPGLPEPLWNGAVTIYDASLYRMSYDWTLSPRLLNHFSIGGNTFIKNSYSPNVGQNWKSKICIKNAVDCNVNFPNISFSEFTGWGSTAYNGTEQPMWAMRDDFSYIHGAHSLKFGYDLESQRANGFGQQNISGQATFSFLETAFPGATSFTSGGSFASFLLGNADSGATETIRYLPQRYVYQGFYAQDDWHVNKKLTVNLGLRYEFTGPPYDVGDQYSNFSPTTPNPAVNNYPGALVFAGFGPGREGKATLLNPWYGAVGPRLGVAYALNSKTTIRAGGSISYGRVTVVSGTTHYSGFIGQYSFSSANQGITPAFNWDTGLPPYPLPPQINPSFANNQNVDYWNGGDSTRAPETFYYTLNIQRQLSQNTVLEAAYDATDGTHLQTQLLNPNQIPMTAVNLLRAGITSAQAQAANIPIPYPNFLNSSIQQYQSVGQALRPFPQYLTIDPSQGGGDKSGHSTYNAFVLKVTRRYSNGLTFQWNYAFSKILTDSDTYYANIGYAEDNGNRKLEKSIGAYDQTHVAKFNTIYELPFGRGRRWLTHGFAEYALGGWRLSAIQIYSTGFPIAVTRNAPLAIYNGVNRPVITTYNWESTWSGSFDPAKDLFLNAAAFPAQPNYLLGNATRFNPLVRAFPNLNENVSMGKSFNFTERLRLDFRAEAFNLFNRTVFGTPVTNLNSTSFGLVTTQANTARQMQLALKVYW